MCHLSVLRNILEIFIFIFSFEKVLSGRYSFSYGQSGSEGAGEDAGQESGEPKPVEYMTVEDDYFADAVFIGDSRTVGMFEYGGLEEVSTFYASKGLTYLSREYR